MTRTEKTPVARAALFLVALVLTPGILAAGEAEQEEAAVPYPLNRCLVADEPLSGEGALSHVYQGQELRFCCPSCLREFESAPGRYLEKMREAVIEDQRAIYPIDTCIVSGQKLGSMGPPVNLLYRNRLVRLCCEGCRNAFEAEPAGFIAKLNAAVIEKQRPDYPLRHCVISGAELGSMGPPVDYVHQGRLVRFCCAGCVPAFEADPQAALEKLQRASGNPPQEKEQP
ncbi:MAG: hypothetical protein GF330_10675 [Candidatus Eisenbacteria bacterium]|nr:hypothetical protein [Candidatus Eisenbacteria bacterium]